MIHRGPTETTEGAFKIAQDFILSGLEPGLKVERRKISASNELYLF
jgi:hypothetical protein